MSGMNIIVQMTGMDRLQLRTKKLIGAAQNALKLIVPDAGQIVATEAQTIVPVLSGRLHDAIHVEPSWSGAFRQCVDRPERQQVVVTPAYISPGSKYGFTPPYARRIEEGFIGPDKLGRMFHQAAQPYMRPAYDAKHEELRKYIKDQMVDALIIANTGSGR